MACAGRTRGSPTSPPISRRGLPTTAAPRAADDARLFGCPNALPARCDGGGHRRERPNARGAGRRAPPVFHSGPFRGLCLHASHLPLDPPDNFEITFLVRGEAAPNNLEF